jgi:monothiol glutaredoxin
MISGSRRRSTAAAAKTGRKPRRNADIGLMSVLRRSIFRDDFRALARQEWRFFLASVLHCNRSGGLSPAFLPINPPDRGTKSPLGTNLPKGLSMTEKTSERIKSIVDSADVVLFMKGVPAQPQCGFSAAVVQVLNGACVPFDAFNVLSDPYVREGIKEFSNWPTIPQLYVKGEFIGGCDIVREMAASGELTQLFADKGVKVSA